MSKWLDKYKLPNKQTHDTSTDSIDVMHRMSILSVPNISIPANKLAPKISEILKRQTDSIDTIATMSTLSVPTFRIIELLAEHDLTWETVSIEFEKLSNKLQKKEVVNNMSASQMLRKIATLKQELKLLN